MSQVVSLFMPTQMRRLAGEDAAASYVGVAFTIGGLMTVAGTSLVLRWLRQPGRVRRTVVALLPCSAIVHLAFVFTDHAFVVITLYALMTLISGAMLPTNNTLIAANVTEDRRGSAFGWVSSAQALSLMLGPIAAATFAAISLDLGYMTTALVLALMALVVFVRLREPNLRDAS
jgi:MFS family permease